MAYHSPCSNEITVYFPSGWNGRLFWQLNGILTPGCSVDWEFEVSDGMEGYFTSSSDGFPDAYFARIAIVDDNLIYPTTACDVTVTATVTCGDEEIGTFTAVVHLIKDSE